MLTGIRVDKVVIFAPNALALALKVIVFIPIAFYR
jgi:hypothetical protein